MPKLGAIGYGPPVQELIKSIACVRSTFTPEYPNPDIFPRIPPVSDFLELHCAPPSGYKGTHLSVNTSLETNNQAHRSVSGPTRQQGESDIS